MLSFLLWGIGLNLYALFMLSTVLAVIIPKGEKREPKSTIGLITFTLIPYAMMIICLVSITILAACNFNYEEYRTFIKDLKNN
ncbi:hypothetical protein [Campylobacter sp. RM16191]|uniref:hypothetical protein n=1 Tax=Campylobacter sp. RM16191 TaxID=1705728 RepID=UPI00147649BD|nr:hypothetical protein [Campylobacter sp. RM16191]